MSVVSLKESGNAAYEAGEYLLAHKLFTDAIQLDPENKVLYCNRSMALSGLENWTDSVTDARKAISLDEKYEKAYYRLVKAYIALKKFKDARLSLMVGFNACGDSKFLKSLEKDLFDVTGVPVRPKPTDFEILQELGEGNFTKVVKALYKPTKVIYAVKTIEKMAIEKTKRRHPNIDNEILMEKRVLNKLDHPNIVPIYSTFQDYGTLYYQMEYLEGGELWNLIQEEGYSVGCHLSLTRFYMYEALLALEYMHRRGIVHRDIKPENMMISSSGHLKLVDFGTCKDLIQTDLNGPEFVGTAEYMSPEVIKSQRTGPETDLWSLGVTMFQLLSGYTPFTAPSPYLSFLRIKRAFLCLPKCTSDDANNLLSLLLTKNAKKRFQKAMMPNVDNGPSSCEEAGNTGESIVLQSNLHDMGKEEKEDQLCDTTTTRGDKSSEDNASLFSYDNLRAHPFFSGVDKTLLHVGDAKIKALSSAVRVPQLSELCLRAVGKSCLNVADAIAANGGTKDGLPAWIKNFNLLKLPPSDIESIKHYLNRRSELHISGVYRLFFNSLVDTRCIRIDASTHNYYGFNRDLQGHWSKEFNFLLVNSPSFGARHFEERKSNATSEPPNESMWIHEMTLLKTTVSAVNKLRPRFVVITGNMVNSEEHDSELFAAQTNAFRRCVARISETIPVLFVPGNKDVGDHPTPSSLAQYRSMYGCDFYGFWYAGVRCLVVNSSLLIHPEQAVNEARYQEVWLEEELEQCKLCAIHVLIFSYHMWFDDAVDYDTDRVIDSSVFPRPLCLKWLNLTRNMKVKYIFTTGDSNLALKPYRYVKATSDDEPADADGGGEKSTDVLPNSQTPIEEIKLDSISVDLKPSEMIQQSKANRSEDENGEGESSESTSSSSDEDEDDDEDEEKSKKEKPTPLSADMSYNGPTQVISRSLSKIRETVDADKGAIRIVFCAENEIFHKLYGVDEIPTSFHLSI